jgi:hypothetical protein
LESVANMHTAADLHIRPWFSNRAGLESRGRREPLRDTACLNSRNGNDSGAMPQQFTSRSQKWAAAFWAHLQRFEFVHGFEPPNRREIFCNSSKYVHKMFTFGGGGIAFSNNLSPLCR